MVGGPTPFQDAVNAFRNLANTLQDQPNPTVVLHIRQRGCRLGRPDAVPDRKARWRNHAAHLDGSAKLYLRPIASLRPVSHTLNTSSTQTITVVVLFKPYRFNGNFRRGILSGCNTSIGCCKQMLTLFKAITKTPHVMLPCTAPRKSGLQLNMQVN